MVECPNSNCGGRLEFHGWDEKIYDEIYICQLCGKVYTIEITEVPDDVFMSD